MKIQDYITKHNLKLFSRQPTTSVNEPWIPAVLMDCPQPDKSSHHRFEIYANSDRTHFVSLNVSRGEFRIFHCEIVSAISEWHLSHHDYIYNSV